MFEEVDYGDPLPTSPRRMAQVRQCTFRRGIDAGCPCVCPLECKFPTPELTARIEAMDPLDLRREIDLAYLRLHSSKYDPLEPRGRIRERKDTP